MQADREHADSHRTPQYALTLAFVAAVPTKELSAKPSQKKLQNSYHSNTFKPVVFV
jgi:hypothetical protein